MLSLLINDLKGSQDLLLKPCGPFSEAEPHVS